MERSPHMKRKLSVICIALALFLCTCISDFAFSQHASGSVAYAASSTSSLSKPEIKAKSSSYEAIKISWAKVKNAKKYYIYRATSKSGEYKKIAETTKLSYSDKKIDQNKTYYYKVKAINGKKSSKYSSIKSSKISTVVKLADIPEYSGSPYIKINDNVPSFSKRMMTEKSSEKYSKLDSLNRPGIAFANIGPDLMPTEERQSIGMIKTAGFQNIRYDDLIEDKYLYNRCHIIGFQLTGENDNINNLITGTRYMNVDGMLPFENQVAEYVKRTGNHVLYRVSPVYNGKNLLCKGLQMEAYSVEDEGKGISFNVFVYNVQPGIVIDYSNGDSHRESDKNSNSSAPVVPLPGSTKPSSGDGIVASPDASNVDPITATYVINTNTKKFHYSYCSSVDDMSEKNKRPSNEDRGSIISQGFVPCKRCNP